MRTCFTKIVKEAMLGKRVILTRSEERESQSGVVTSVRSEGNVDGDWFVVSLDNGETLEYYDFDDEFELIEDN